MKVILNDTVVYDELVTLREKLYREALEKISETVAIDGDYEGAYWDMVLEADSALYPEEYSRKDKEDGKELDETSKDS